MAGEFPARSEDVVTEFSDEAGGQVLIVTGPNGADGQKHADTRRNMDTVDVYCWALKEWHWYNKHNIMSIIFFIFF